MTYRPSYGGTRDVIAESEEIRDELIRVVFGVWDHLKNHGDHGAENQVLTWVGTVLAKRESRRFLGDHVLCQSDVESQRLFRDRVADSAERLGHLGKAGLLLIGIRIPFSVEQFLPLANHAHKAVIQNGDLDR